MGFFDSLKNLMGSNQQINISIEKNSNTNPGVKKKYMDGCNT